MPNVISVRPDTLLQLADLDPLEPLSPQSWGLNRIDQVLQPLSTGIEFTQGYTGKGVTVYVLDTGYNFDHFDYKNGSDYNGTSRVSCGADFINEVTFPDGIELPPCYDLDGHGSHTTGTVVGTLFGAAKQAKAFHVKVCRTDTPDVPGGCPQSALFRGLEWAINHHKANNGAKSSVLSFSIGGPADLNGLETARAVSDAGIIMVVAAGKVQIIE